MKTTSTPVSTPKWFKKLFLLTAFVCLSVAAFSQTANIVIDGTNVYVSENTKYPFWLSNPQTLAAGTNVTSISVLEYRITASPGGDNVLQFVAPLKITTTQTVPAGKTWKVEAALLNPAVGVANNGWTDDGTVVRLTTSTDNVGIGNATPSQKLDVTGKLALSGKEAFDGGDTWLRLNQSSHFASGVYTPNFLRADGGIASGGLGSLGGGTITATGIINSNIGYQISNGAASGNYLRGNGTNFVSSAIQVGDVPGGSGNYIQNQYGSAQGANMWITGEAKVGSWFRNANASQGLYNEATGRHFYSEGNSYWTVADANGLIFRNNHASTITGYVYWDGTAGSNNFGLLSPSGNWRVRVDNSNTEAYGGFYASTSYIPYIYDRDNTGYYLDPNGNTYVNSFQTGTMLSSWPGYNGLTQAYGHYIWPGRNDGSGAWWNQSWYLAGHSSYGLYTNTGIYIAGTSWVPYLYDANNTGYYLDMDGSSRTNYFGRNYGWNWTEYDWNDGQYYMDLHATSILNDLRSRIWYDYDNTGYYIDGNGGSNLNYATANDWYVNSWFRVNGGGGIYWQAYGGGWYMVDGTWLRSYNNKSVLSQVNSSAPAIRGDQSAGGYWASEFYGSPYAVYASGWIYSTYYGYLSSRTLKHDIEKFEEADYESSFAFMDDLNLNYYKLNSDKEYNTVHVGFIAEETPGNLTTPGKMGARYGELSLYNTGAIKVMKKKLDAMESQLRNISDFGAENINGNSAWVNFSDDFKSQLNSIQPVVVVTPLQTGTSLSISQVTGDGFRVNNAGNEATQFSWIAMAKLPAKNNAAEKGYSAKFTEMLNTNEYEMTHRPAPKQSQVEVANPATVTTTYDPVKNHEETKNKPAIKIDQAEADKAGGWIDPAKLVPLHDKDPNIIETGPAKNPDAEKMRKEQDAAKKFVPVDEASPLKGDPTPDKSGAPK